MLRETDESTIGPRDSGPGWVQERGPADASAGPPTRV